MEAGRRKGVSEGRNRTIRKLPRQGIWESGSGHSRPMEALGPAFGAVPQPPQSSSWVIPEQEQKEEVV